jgi:hypothetical protein
MDLRASLNSEFLRKTRVLDTMGVEYEARPLLFKQLLNIQRYSPSWYKDMFFYCAVANWDPTIIHIENAFAMDQSFVLTPASIVDDDDSLFSTDEIDDITRRLVFQ